MNCLWKTQFLWKYKFDTRPDFKGSKLYRDVIPKGRAWDEVLALPGLPGWEEGGRWSFLTLFSEPGDLSLAVLRKGLQGDKNVTSHWLNYGEKVPC